MTGHCSQCHRVWTLETEQGLCQWCGQPSSCQTNGTQALRSIKSRSNGRKRQAEHNGNGYDRLDGKWLTYYKVASQFSHKARAQDTEDLLHTIVANLADAGRNNGHKPDNDSWLYRIASLTVAQYWRTYYKLTNVLDCQHCRTEQRRKCKKDWLYSDCPKLVKVESLSKPIVDAQGNVTELGELIADDKALDLDAWLDSRTFLLGCPDRLIAIAQKRLDGIPLINADLLYLSKWRRKEQKRLL